MATSNEVDRQTAEECLRAHWRITQVESIVNAIATARAEGRQEILNTHVPILDVLKQVTIATEAGRVAGLREAEKIAVKMVKTWGNHAVAIQPAMTMLEEIRALLPPTTPTTEEAE